MWNNILWPLSYILAVALGVFIGYLWGQAERQHRIAHGEPVETDRKPRITMVQRVFAGVITILAIVMVVQTSAASERDKRQAAESQAIARAQSVCNAQLYSATEMNAEDEKLQREDNASLLALVERLITLPPDGEDEMRDALRDYREQVHERDKRRMENDVKRAQNRHPAPDCGMEHK